MNILNKFKLISKIIKIAELVEKKFKSNKESVNDALFFVKTYIPEARAGKAGGRRRSLVR